MASDSDNFGAPVSCNTSMQQFLSDLQKMELTAADERQQKHLAQDWEQDVKDPMEKVMMMKDKPRSIHHEQSGGNRMRGRGNRRPNYNRGRWNNHNRAMQHNRQFANHHPPPPPLSFFSNRCPSPSSSVRSDQSGGSSFHRGSNCGRRGSGGGGRNFMNYYESDVQSVSGASSLDEFATSVSQQPAKIVTPTELAGSLVRFPECQATLLTLLDQCHYDHKQVRQLVARHADTFELQNETIKLRPTFGVCQSYMKEDSCYNPEACQDLHICSQYLMGVCRDKGCLFGHVLHTNHNKPILAKFHLNSISVKLLFGLLKTVAKASGGSLTKLEVCENFNGAGCTEEQCKKLHLCLNLLAKRCSNASGCPLNHNPLEKQSKKLLESHGFDLNDSPRDIITRIASSPLVREIVEALQPISTSAPDGDGKEAKKDEVTASEKDKNADIASQTPSNDAVVSETTASPVQKEPDPPRVTTWSYDFKGEVSVNEICYNSVEGYCPYEESGCWRLHSDFHFYWQVRSKRDSNNKFFWANLTNEQNIALEKAFCDPSLSKTPLPQLNPSTLGKSAKGLLAVLNGRSKWEADLESLKLLPVGGDDKNYLRLRRLCTEYLPDNSTIPEACVFKWFFLDKNKQWIEYGSVDSTGEENLKCDITSDDIEKSRRQNGADSVIQFKSQSFNYLLDLQNMTQTNLKTNATRKVRRRPTPHIKEERGAIAHHSSKEDLPPSWDPLKPEERFRRVVLDPSTPEYQKVLNHVQQNGGNGINVTKVERVQNPYSYRAFQNKVQEMLALYKDMTVVDVRQLFHGTNPDIVPKICEENFDWRLHGSNAGQAHGRGTYFSPFASTSHGYTRPDATNNRYMFIARVAVGTMTQGNSGVTRPPINPQYNIPYDATANQTQNPSIIVKYDKAEYFPEYILTIT